MPTLPDVSLQPAFFASQAIIADGQITAYSSEWHVYHRDSLTSVATAATQTEALELADAAIHELAAMMRARAPAEVAQDPFLRAPGPLPQLVPPAQARQEYPTSPEEALAPVTAGTNWRHRYSIRANPEAKVGEMVSVSFRLPENVRDALVLRTAKLKELGDPGIETPTDALQDAVVCWLLMEGVI